MEYANFCTLLNRWKQHLIKEQSVSMEELLQMGKKNERIRNFAVLYSLTSPDNFHTFLKLSYEDAVVEKMLLDLHTALEVPGDPSLRSVARMLRNLPFVQRTVLNLDGRRNPVNEASQQIAKFLRSLERQNRLFQRPRSFERSKYVEDRRSGVKLVKK